jgi:hypothetical protein
MVTPSKLPGEVEMFTRTTLVLVYPYENVGRRIAYKCDTTGNNHAQSRDTVHGSGTSCVGNWGASGGSSSNDTGTGNGGRGNTGSGSNAGGGWASVDSDSPKASPVN